MTFYIIRPSRRANLIQSQGDVIGTGLEETGRGPGKSQACGRPWWDNEMHVHVIVTATPFD